ncbi:MAG: holo-ACP synthase [Clostridiales bacterium]|nr:holo-ACP synthase [Clostridiales bacterium]
MILGLGIDLCQIDKIEEIVAETHFLQRYFSQEEIAYIQKKNMAAAQSAAAIFAAKEAALKAFGTGFGAFNVKEIALLHLPSGQPYYALTGKAKEYLKEIGGKAIHVSISHEGNMAIAIAIIEGEKK